MHGQQNIKNYSNS